MGKINKEFMLSDSSVNTYGFRLLTSGYQLSEFNKNPIGYFMHDRNSGVLVKWENLQIKGDQILGIPNINPSNIRAEQTINEINQGYLNAASMGHIVVLESSDDLNLKLPNQTGPTITKWFNRECSLVDIPANVNSISLFDKEDNPLPLNLFAVTQNLVSSKHNPIENDGAEIDVDALLQSAIKNNDITAEQATVLKEQFINNPDKLKSALHDFSVMRIKKLMEMNWDDLDKQGLLPELKEKYLQGFQKKYYTEFGKDHKSVEEQKSISGNSNDIDSENKRLMEFAIKNKDVDPEMAALWKVNFKNNPEKLNRLLKEAVNKRVETLMEMKWDDLDKKDLLAELKQKYLQGFKLKFKEHFGLDYTENRNNL